MRAHPDEDGISVYFTDVTERKERERTLERYETVMETISDVVVTVNEAGVVQTVNPAVEDVLGYDPETLVGESLSTLVPPRLQSEHEAAFGQYAETGEKRLDWEYLELPGRHRDGSEIPLAVSFSEYEHDGEQFFTGVLRDITARKERERTLDELLESTRAFIQASERTELTERVVEDVAAVFDYDLSVVRMHDPETGTLPPTRASPETTERLPDLSTYDDDEGPAGAAFQSGEATIVEDTAATGYDLGPVASAMYLPLGDHGVLGVGSLDADAFEPDDVRSVEILALAATSAFDRLERETATRQLQRIITHVDEMVFLLDADDRFTFVTSTLATYLGRAGDELVGTHLADVVAPPDVDAVENALAEFRREDRGERRVLEVDVRTGRGTTSPAELELSPTEGSGYDDIAGVVLDISELARTRSHLERERERFQELFENLPDPVVEVEFDRAEPVVRYANPAFADVFGHDPERVRGEPLNDLIVSESERASARALDRRVSGGERTTVEIQCETADRRRDFLLRGIPYSREGGSYGFAVYTDITDQRERERYLKVLNRVFRHNLRNDMNVVMSMGRRLADNVEDDELAENARTLRDKAEEVATLGEKAKKIERALGRRTRDAGAVDVASHLRAVVDAQREATPEAAIALDLPAELWVEGWASVRQAFEELVENAVEHNDADTPHLAVEARDAERDGWVELRFVDDGPGLPDQEWRILSGEESITQLTHGSGLGLWLTRWVVRSCGGELNRETHDGGTRLTLRFRRAER
ncbi:MAG: PAS domain S-box protein [Haloplanus sp.]